jgi:hypothetical protein
VTGGDSGIGRAVAAAFAREGADVAICYLTHHDDAKETVHLVTKEGRKCIAIAGDASDEAFAEEAVAATLQAFGKIDILARARLSLCALRHTLFFCVGWCHNCVAAGWCGATGEPRRHPDAAGVHHGDQRQAAARDVRGQCLLHVCVPSLPAAHSRGSLF